jgi:DNA-binding transcriptional ArsR family regulator
MEKTDIVNKLEALAQETRLDIVRLLVRHGEDSMSSGEIAAKLDLASATLAFHLNKLVQTGLVRRHTSGRNRFYRADIGAVYALAAYLVENCCSERYASEQAGHKHVI